MSEGSTREWRVRVRCPDCKRESFVPPGFVGRVGLCPGCRDPLRVPDPGRPPKRAQEAIASTPPLELPPSDPELLERARWAVGTAWEEVDLAPPPPKDTGAHCRACGEPIRPRAHVCDHCGEHQVEGAGYEDASGVATAAPWKRGVALVINLLILAPSLICAGVGLAAFDGSVAWIPPSSFVPALTLAGALFLLTSYLQLRFSIKHAASIGKRLVGLRVIQAGGQSAGLRTGILLREGLFWILLTPLCAGLGLVVHALSALLVFSGQPRALHDMLAGTLVVETGSHID